MFLTTSYICQTTCIHLDIAAETGEWITAYKRQSLLHLPCDSPAMTYTLNIAFHAPPPYSFSLLQRLQSFPRHVAKHVQLFLFLIVLCAKMKGTSTVAIWMIEGAELMQIQDKSISENVPLSCWQWDRSTVRVRLCFSPPVWNSPSSRWNGRQLHQNVEDGHSAPERRNKETF